MQREGTSTKASHLWKIRYDKLSLLYDQHVVDIRVIVSGRGL